MVNDALKSNPIDLTRLVIDWLLVHGPRIVIILGLALLLRTLENFFVMRFIRHFAPSLNDAPTEHMREATLIRITRNIFNVFIWIVAGLMILSEVGVNIGPMLAAAGLAAVAVLFGGQSFLRDIIAGMFVVLENQYHVGDVICIDKTCGTVEDLTIRKVMLRDLDGTVHHIPHGTVQKVSNLTKGFARVNINLKLTYDADIEKAASIINEIGETMAREDAFRDDTLKPIHFDSIDGFEDTGMAIKVLGEFRATKQWGAASEFRKRVKIAFDEAGIRFANTLPHAPGS